MKPVVDGRLPHQLAAADTPGFVVSFDNFARLDNFGRPLVPAGEASDLPADKALRDYFGLIDAGWADTEKDPLRWNAPL